MMEVIRMRRILSKVKGGFRRVVSRRKRKTHAKVSRISKAGKLPKQKPLPSKRKATLKKLPIESAVRESKFYTPAQVEEGKRAPSFPAELPSGYAQDRIVLQVRDPWWIHAYWEITESTWERLRREFPAILAGDFKSALRAYDISQIKFRGDNAHRFFDIEVTPEANNWYIDTQGPGRSWCVDFGFLLNDDRFITIVRSNTVSTPLDGPSWITDEEWMIPEDMFTRLYGMGVGMGSSPLKLKRL
jgi:hypothetical protein